MYMISSYGLCLLLFCLTAKVALARENEHFESIFAALPDLQNIPPPSSKPGGFGYDICCRFAIMDSVKIENKTLVVMLNDNVAVTSNASDLINNFPCGSKFVPGKEPASDVNVTLDFYKNQCGGSWQLSAGIRQWALPFVGFILPAVFFCYSIPRAYRLWIPDTLFPTTIGRCWKRLELLYKIPLASFLAIIDNFVLVSIVFTQAGPMILSGLRDARLGIRMINYVVNQENRIVDSDLVRLLLVFLVSNLEHDPAWVKVEEVVNRFKNDRDRNRFTKVKNQLSAMLDSQMNFGLIVGAPAIYYVGAFIYTIIEMRESLGDNDVSQALAFGEFWMVIPHVAVVSCCLLGGNNPNTLQVLVADDRDNGIDSTAATARQPLVALLFNNIFTRVYSSTYQPVTMWRRGESTNKWLRRLTVEYPKKYPGLGDKIALSLGDRIGLNLICCTLISIPCFLGGITAYTTPLVGLSCRSLTILVYFLSQAVLIILKNLEHILWETSHYEWREHEKRTWQKGLRSWEHAMLTVWYFLYGFATFAAFFSAIVGTMLQLIGVYRNFLCSSLVTSWGNLNSSDIKIPVGSNSEAQQVYAQSFWIPTGIAAVLFLVVICFGCWWYQTQLRMKYTSIIDKSFHENR